MAHPHLGGGRNALEQWVSRHHFAGGPAVLARRSPSDAAPQGITRQLHPVADAENGDAESEQGGVAAGGPLLVDARRATGEDDPPGGDVAEAAGGDVVTDDLAEDILLPHPAGDQLGILRAEIEDDDPLGTGRGVRRRCGPGSWLRHGGGWQVRVRKSWTV